MLAAGELHSLQRRPGAAGELANLLESSLSAGWNAHQPAGGDRIPVTQRESRPKTRPRSPRAPRGSCRAGQARQG
jgi:hypothetical protein